MDGYSRGPPKFWGYSLPVPHIVETSLAKHILQCLKVGNTVSINNTQIVPNTAWKCNIYLALSAIVVCCFDKNDKTELTSTEL